MTFSKFAAGLSGALMALALILDPSGGAHAQEADVVSIEIQVDAAGLRSGDPVAVQAAHNSIVLAARRACGLSGGVRLSLEERRDARTCAQAAIEDTVARAEAPALARYFAALSGQRRYTINTRPMPETALAAVDRQ